MFKSLMTFFVGLSAVAAMAGTITVSSPTNGTFLGRTNTFRFTITGSFAQARVVVRVISETDPNRSFTFQQDFNPNVDRQIEGSIPINFSETTPEGLYRMEVRVTEPNNTYNQPNITGLTIDVVQPRFRDTTPISGAFVRGDVPIIVNLEERNLELWRVQVNSQDIPNNTGATSNINVLWSTGSIQTDGAQTISIRVEDKANNVSNRSINVTVDRRAPSTTVLSPTSTRFRPGATIPVLINFVDQFQNSILFQNVDVLVKDMSDRTLSRVARLGTNQNGSTLQWTGRIRSRGLPRQFKLVVSAVDRAGNPAATQTVIVNLR